MRGKQLSKTNIIRRIAEKDVFDFYLRPFHNKAFLREGMNISNPFIKPKRQKTPSFNIYRVKGGNHWRYKDFATGEEGDVFELIKQLYQCDFYQALMIINNDFSLGLTPKF